MRKIVHKGSRFTAPNAFVVSMDESLFLFLCLCGPAESSLGFRQVSLRCFEVVPPERVWPGFWTRSVPSVASPERSLVTALVSACLNTVLLIIRVCLARRGLLHNSFHWSLFSSTTAAPNVDGKTRCLTSKAILFLIQTTAEHCYGRSKVLPSDCKTH